MKAKEMNSVNKKTVFVIEGRHFFTRRTSNESIEFDVICKSKQTPAGIIPLTPISKSLWTSTIEAIQEYARVVWDIFLPSHKAIAFVTYDCQKSTQLSGWNENEQCLNFFNACFAKASMNSFLNSTQPSPTYDDSAFISGLQTAIEALCVPTKTQEERIKNKQSDLNKGRIILISYFKSDSQIKAIAEYILDGLRKCNHVIANTVEMGSFPRKLPLNELNLVIINTHPINEPSKVTDLPHHEISSNVSCEVISVKSGSFIASKLMSLVLNHYNLASTTVTGIPMKEEQNASSSANYDVELLHPSEAHIDLGDAFNIKSIKEGAQYETVSLKWCTPRTSSVDLHYCSGAYRVTSVDVNSRPSSCLTHFLLNGRTVLLEMPKSKGTKVMSHMLSSHNGEIFIHTLGTGRSVLEDPPSISEGSGGRVTDYRINEFGALMKKFHLVRCKTLQISGKEIIPPIEKARLSLMRQTLYWPMVIGHTIIFNISSQIQPLINLIPKETLTIEGDMNECKKAIYQIVNMESKATPLPVPSIASRGKGPKREELYKLLWKELEHFLSVYATTPEHNAILNCLRELHAKPENQTEHSASSMSSSPPQATTTNGAVKKELKDESELAWKELDAYNQMTEREKTDTFSEPVHKKPRLSNKSSALSSTSSESGPQSLYSIWMKKLEECHVRKHPEFAGRTLGTNIAPLYVNLNEKHDL
ncbi:hypothetical protein B4U79_00949 [Dinothrombium tinctorium]|uniref:Protein asunder n=1 Tax=Dinothrombium tinctorium TaxID=1965070 RepID=A0A443RRH4_9ACAR|nr:hypothetical protein B4U79_00949 [Dinothrombium tinctorium]